MKALRRSLRDRFFSFLSRAFESDTGRRIAVAATQGTFEPCASKTLARLRNLPSPHLDSTRTESGALSDRQPLFITARFRSGSTLLWNIFRASDGFTAYYEPMNERQWFDPSRRGEWIDPTHRQAQEYWKEYEGLEELGRYYRLHWTDRDLYMDESFWDPGLRRYLDFLIERAPGQPVLQFNRMDFRLPWLRQQYPEARILHLWRNPRDQWCSTLRDPASYGKEARIQDFAEYDGYYLMNWVRDLQRHFPFVDETTVNHPYPLSYLIWKLSYVFGLTYSDVSISFESLIRDPAGTMAAMAAGLRIEKERLTKGMSLIERPSLHRWKEYAPESWFLAHEEACEEVLDRFLGRASPAPRTNP